MTRLAPSVLLLLASTACLYTSDADQQELLDSYYDTDGDGFRSLAGGGDDCDDADASVNPDASELCNGVDDDCDGTADNDPADGGRWFTDDDGDGFGLDTTAVDGCQPEGAVATGGDCDDQDASVHPDADEMCDGVDRNCDGTVDDPSALDALTAYADADADGFGDASVTAVACEVPEGFVLDDTDCDDTDSATFPGSVEVCDDNGRDEDCDGVANDDDTDEPPEGALWWYVDDDNDGYGDMHDPGVALCEDGALMGLTLDHADCDDGDAGTNPPSGSCRLAGAGIDPAIFADAFLRGPDVYSALGGSVGTAGDQDGDGLPEVALGAIAQERPDGTRTGAVFIENGWQSGNYTPGTETVAVLTGEVENGAFGLVTDALDLNDDGFTDLVVGAPAAEAGGVPVGAAYLFNGPLTGSVPATMAAARIIGAPGFAGAGWGLDAVGDVDGDGHPDLLVAAFVLEDELDEPASSYLIRGPIAGDYVLGSDEDAIFVAPEEEAAGADISGVGDLDGDGLTDVAVGAPTWRNPGAGALEALYGRVYIVYGGFSTGTVPLPNADVILEGNSYQTLGSRLHTAGDFDGDGTDDLLIGAPFAGISLDPRVWVVPGTGLSSGNIDAAASLQIHDASIFAEMLGFALGAGNVDGDGFSDIIIGSPGWNADAGRAMLVYGDSALSGVFTPQSVSDTLPGVRFEGTQPRQGPANNPSNEGASLGLAASIVADVNRDGRDDVLLGAPFHDVSLQEQGAAFLFLGGQAP